MKRSNYRIRQGDCLVELKALESDSVDLAYLDPPFFTNRKHFSTTRDRTRTFAFHDVWGGLDEYAQFMEVRLREIYRVLRPTGSIFVHCDSNANYLIRVLLNKIFGDDQFRSEIIWAYKRWSNSAKGLLPAHQTIMFYSKTNDFKFNTIYGPYSETTNVDQILQLRSRDKHGVSTYATDSDGNVMFGGAKKGVPLSDVWEIPFLNPKAKERVGYPTQKPIVLLERIISLCTNEDDLVLDPFCGSGTTLVAANILCRQSIGIDISAEAVTLTEHRLQNPVRTDSALLKKGRSAYLNADSKALAVLSTLDILPVQRNLGIDAFIKMPATNSMIPVRVQREGETIEQAAGKLLSAVKSKNVGRAILVRTHPGAHLFSEETLPEVIKLVDEEILQRVDHLPKLLAELDTELAKVNG